MQDIKPKFTILKNRVRKVVLLIDKAIRALPESQFITIEQVWNQYIYEIKF